MTLSLTWPLKTKATIWVRSSLVNVYLVFAISTEMIKKAKNTVKSSYREKVKER